MNSSQKLASAIASILSIQPAVLYADQATAPAATGSDAIGEIIVTAQRRSENIQDVPITVQALTADTLLQLNATTLDDYTKYLPNVTRTTSGPGQGSIYIRGLAYAAGGSQSSGTSGPIPTVAIYLDDQSMSLPGRNVDIYAADLERIEVLEGPQGTLFGGGAQAGVVRYITNKPKLDVTEGGVDASYSTTAHGDPNSNVSAVLNLPIIADTLAVRGVIYTDSRGGYINNVPSEFTRSGTDLGLALRNGGTVSPGGTVITPGQVPADSVVINNANIAGNHSNPLNYTGLRLSALYRINDDWEALLGQTYQNMDAEGVFYDNPYGSEGNALPPLSVTLFNPSYDKDRFENTSLTINGKIDGLKLTYAGAYLARNVDQVQDYTNYARGVWATYYQCNGYSVGFDPVTKCYSPSATWYEKEKNTHQSHELRLTTPNDNRLRAIGGLYYEDYRIYDDTDWLERTVPQCTASFNTECFLNIGPFPGTQANDPKVRNASDGFFEDTHRGFSQRAAFASADFDLIPKALTLTVGTRYFKYDAYERGSVVGSFYCKIYDGAVATNLGPCSANNYNGFGPGGPSGTNLNLLVPNTVGAHGFRSRVDLAWKPVDGVLVYYTYSQGFRPPGFNQSTGSYLPDKNGIAQFLLPAVYQSDDLTNNEVGWKTEWLDHRIQFNGSVYQEEWSNVQTGFFDPEGGLGNVAFTTNGPAYRVRGVEPSLEARVTHGLTVTAAASWNSSSQTNSPYLTDNNPKSPSFGKNITSIPNPYGPIGSSLPNSPPFQGNLRVRYERQINDYTAFVQVAAQHRAHSYSATGYVEAYDQPGYSTYDASFGVAKGNWYVQAFGQNLTDVLAASSINSGQFILAETPLRPRILGINVSYKFSNR